MKSIDKHYFGNYTCAIKLAHRLNDTPSLRRKVVAFYDKTCKGVATLNRNTNKMTPFLLEAFRKQRITDLANLDLYGDKDILDRLTHCVNNKFKMSNKTNIIGELNFYKGEALRWRLLYQEQRGGAAFDELQKEVVELRNRVRETEQNEN